MCICVCVCVCVCVYIYIYIYMNEHVHIYLYVFLMKQVKNHNGFISYSKYKSSCWVSPTFFYTMN